MSNDPHRRLMAALSVHLGELADLTSKTRDWSSATFTGVQHQIEMSVPRSARIAALTEAELPMNGHFVADLRIISTRAVAERVRLILEVLTIAEA